MNPDTLELHLSFQFFNPLSHLQSLQLSRLSYNFPHNQFELQVCYMWILMARYQSDEAKVVII